MKFSYCYYICTCYCEVRTCYSFLFYSNLFYSIECVPGVTARQLPLAENVWPDAVLNVPSNVAPLAQTGNVLKAVPSHVPPARCTAAEGLLSMVCDGLCADWPSTLKCTCTSSIAPSTKNRDKKGIILM